MRNTRIMAGVLLASCLFIPQANAAGLLGGALGGGSGGSTSTSTGVPGVATVSVNNASTGTTGNATVLDGGGSTVNLGLHDLIGGNSNLGVTLPGTGDGNTDGLLGNGTDSVNGATDNGGTVDTLLGNAGVSGDDGGLGGAIGGNGGLLGGDLGGGLLGGGGAGDGTGGDGTGGDGTGILGGGGVAGGVGVAGAAACNQDARGLAQFLQARYSPNALGSWAHAANVQVVPVRVCPQIKAALGRATASSASISMLRGMAASDPLISTSLSRTRYSAGNVLGVRQANGMLTVYVY